MARIKQILNERRLAYEQAYALEYASFKDETRRAREGGKEPGREERDSSEAVRRIQ